MLKRITDQTGITVVVASHDAKVHHAATHLFELQAGQLVDETHVL